MSALNEQVGGDHYKDMPIGPTEFCQINKIPACESSIIQYMCRHHRKGGVQDLRKAQHLIDMIIELEYPAAIPKPKKDRPAKEESYQIFCNNLLADMAVRLGLKPEELQSDGIWEYVDPVDNKLKYSVTPKDIYVRQLATALRIPVAEAAAALNSAADKYHTTRISK